MTVGAGIGRGILKLILAGIGGALVAASATAAHAVVVEGAQPLPQPPMGYVAQWNGSSAVAVAPQWVLSARHVGGNVGGLCVVRGEWYQCVELRPHPTLDLQLVRLDRPLPGWHGIAAVPAVGTHVLLGGWGVTTTGPLPGNIGWNWLGPHAETWGANRIESVGVTLRIRFDAPGPNAVPHEAAFANNDSGAGLFVQGTDGQLLLTGIAVSVSGFGNSQYGVNGYCVEASQAREWIVQTTGLPTGHSVAELFEFLSWWFDGDPRADFDQSGSVEVADIFAFLNDWFNG